MPKARGLLGHPPLVLSRRATQVQAHWQAAGAANGRMVDTANGIRHMPEVPFFRSSSGVRAGAFFSPCGRRTGGCAHRSWANPANEYRYIVPVPHGVCRILNSYSPPRRRRRRRYVIRSTRIRTTTPHLHKCTRSVRSMRDARAQHTRAGVLHAHHLDTPASRRAPLRRCASAGLIGPDSPRTCHHGRRR